MLDSQKKALAALVAHAGYLIFLLSLYRWLHWPLLLEINYDRSHITCELMR